MHKRAPQTYCLQFGNNNQGDTIGKIEEQMNRACYIKLKALKIIDLIVYLKYDEINPSASSSSYPQLSELAPP